MRHPHIDSVKHEPVKPLSNENPRRDFNTVRIKYPFLADFRSRLAQGPYKQKGLATQVSRTRLSVSGVPGHFSDFLLFACASKTFEIPFRCRGNF